METALDVHGQPLHSKTSPLALLSSHFYVFSGYTTSVWSVSSWNHTPQDGFHLFSSMKSPMSLSFLQVMSPFCIHVPWFGFPAAAVRSCGRRCCAWVALGQCWREPGGLFASTFTPAISGGFLELPLQRCVLGELSVCVET